MALVQPTFDKSACQLSTVGHISALPNVVICWFLGPELSLADGVSTLQLQLFGTHFRHGYTLPPLVMDNSGTDSKPTSSYKSSHDALRTLVQSVYLLTLLLSYLLALTDSSHIACYHNQTVPSIND